MRANKDNFTTFEVLREKQNDKIPKAVLNECYVLRDQESNVF